MEILDIVAVLAAVVLIGLGMLGLYVVYVYYKIKGRVDRMIAEVIAEAEADLIGLDIEVDKGVYFCYNNKDKQFVCQGTTVQEIREGFQKRYPDKTAYLAGGDPAVVTEFKSQLLKLAINENSPSV